MQSLFSIANLAWGLIGIATTLVLESSKLIAYLMGGILYYLSLSLVRLISKITAQHMCIVIGLLAFFAITGGVVHGLIELCEATLSYVIRPIASGIATAISAIASGIATVISAIASGIATAIGNFPGSATAVVGRIAKLVMASIKRFSAGIRMPTSAKMLGYCEEVCKAVWKRFRVAFGFP
jgi:phage-related protein